MRRWIVQRVRIPLRLARRSLVYVGPAAIAAVLLAIAWAPGPLGTDRRLAVGVGLAAAIALTVQRRLIVRRHGRLLTGPPRKVRKAAAADDRYEIFGIEKEATEALELIDHASSQAAYLQRDVDDELPELIREAMGRREPSLIVLSGPPRSGKTRTLSGAASGEAGSAWLMVPRDAAAVRKLANDRPPVPLTSWRRPCVLWLDDLERFIRPRGDGLDAGVVAAFSGWRRPVILLATAGGKGLRFSRTDPQQLAIEQGRLLRTAELVTISDTLSDTERDRLRRNPAYGPKAAEAIGSLGIAEFMVAATRKRLLLDVPSERPVLGIEPVARVLRDIVVQSDPRFAIGIFGGWGSGKTTLMRAIETRLRDRDVVCVPFVAWRYEKEEHLIVPLLDAIRDALVTWADEHDHDQAARHTAATVGHVVSSILAGVTLQAGLPGAMKASFDANASLQAYRGWSNDEKARRVPRSFYHASFVALKDAFGSFVAAGADRRIVVFVDDLDRCLPENALQILESMKLFFDLDGFVFVVGLDQDVIEYAVEKRYGAGSEDNGGQRISGEEYIKKIFQLPYPLSPVSTSQLADFVRAASEEAQLGDEQKRELRTVVEPHLRFLAREGAINPREVKRYINLYTLQSQVHDDLNPDVVLTLQTLDFRQDWRNTIRLDLVERRDEFLEGVRRRLALADGTTATGELLELPDEFLAYVAERAPGHALLETESLDRYLAVGESVLTAKAPALLDALGLFGQFRTELKAARGGDVTAGLAGELSALLSQVEGRVKTSGSADGDATLAELRALKRDVADVVGSLEPEDLPAPDELAARLAPLEQRASTLSRRLRRLYRAGEPDEAIPAEEPVEPTAADTPPPEVHELHGRRLEELAPEDVGVDSGAASAPYVARGVDDLLRRELGRAAETGKPVMVIIHGASKAGKSRTLYEAVRATPELSDAIVVLPTGVADVRAALDPEALRRLPPGPVVLWLDDLERFLGSGGLRAATVTAVARLPRRIVAVATAEAYAPILGDDLSTHPDVRHVLLSEGLSQDEVQRFRDLWPDADVDAVQSLGLGAWLTGSERLSQRLAAAEPGRAAIVRAAVDWARAGMARPITAAELRELWRAYLPDRSETDGFEPALAWATEPVEGAGPLLADEPGGYRAADWVVEHADAEVNPEVWKLVLDGASPEEALEIGARAAGLGEVDHAAAAFARAEHSNEPEVAAAAFLASGRLLARTGDDKGAEAAYRRAERRGSLDATVELGEMNLRRGNRGAARAAFQSADDRGHPHAATLLGQLLAGEDDEGARAAFRRADERGDLAGTVALAQLLAGSGDPTGAMDAFGRADERGSAEAALGLGLLAQQRGDVDGALAALRRADERGSAAGAYSLGVMLADAGRADEARAAYGRAIDRRRTDQAAAELALDALARLDAPR